MDRFIARYRPSPDQDLMLCRAEGVAYQANMKQTANYDAEYYDKCASYEGKDIALKINAGRVALVDKFIGVNRVVDIGIGSGEFIRNRPNTYGYDVNPVAEEWLKRNDLWANRLEDFSGYSMFDVIEHVPEPEVYLKKMMIGTFLFVSIPIMYSLGAIRLSRHYRPGEHLYYFTEDGFVSWMWQHGFAKLEMQTFEIAAGRESIYSFAFRRTMWPHES